MDLQPYVELEEMVYIAVKVEKQLQGRGATRYVSKPFPNSNSSWKRDGKMILKVEIRLPMMLLREGPNWCPKRSLNPKRLKGEIETLSVGSEAWVM